MWVWCVFNLMSRVKRPQVGVERKFEEREVPVQALSSSSDRANNIVAVSSTSLSPLKTLPESDMLLFPCETPLIVVTTFSDVVIERGMVQRGVSISRAPALEIAAKVKYCDSTLAIVRKIHSQTTGTEKYVIVLNGAIGFNGVATERGGREKVYQHPRRQF
ncbi:hypothetical protein AVEN_164473-1 [Araneus ventricosus]|uniref:Uncharacterized protein n=1 Tax=Araneus ventricosus TaxID=182803 RepID=A0A4Y2S4U6_ARAVE|nr:hypothetical protein AVEN_73546-1 [Araneus ventricosus]GBN83248.1 hypothetical protein AVEN_164473-1 [Araneus ventricosus]